MSRLTISTNLLLYYGIGVREGLVLALVHLYVETPIHVLAEACGDKPQTIGALVGCLRHKGLIVEGTPRARTRVYPGQRTKEKTWRLTSKVKAELDAFESYGTMPKQATKRPAARAAGRRKT